MPTLKAQKVKLLDELCQKILASSSDSMMITSLEVIFQGKTLDKLKKGKNMERVEVAKYIERFLENIYYPKIKAVAYGKLATEYIKDKKYSEAYASLKKSGAYIKTANSIENFYHNIYKFECFSHLNKTDSAIYSGKKALEISKNISNDTLSIVASMKLAGAYRRSKLYDKSITHFKRLVNSNSKYVRFNNVIGLVYQTIGRYDSSHYYFQKILKHHREEKSDIWVGIISGNVAQTYFLEGKYTEAVEYALVDLKYFEDDNHGTNVILTRAYTNLNQLENAKRSLEEARKAVVRCRNQSGRDAWSFLRDFYEAEMELADKTNQPHLAYQSLKKCIAYRDSVTNNEIIQNAKQIDAQLDFDQQRKEIEVLHHANEAQSKAQTRTYYMLLAVCGGLILSVAFISFLQYINLSRKRTNHLLLSQKEEISTQTEELRVMNEQLVELDQFKQNLTNMVVHDLKNPLNAILHTAESDMPATQKRLIKGYSQQMLNLVLNVLDIQKFEEAKMFLDKQEINVLQLIEMAMSQVEFLTQQKHIKIQVNALPTLFGVCDVDIVLRVLTNLLHNALKYAPQNSKITVKAHIREESLYCSIKDEGIGIPQDKLGILFQKYTQLDMESRKKFQSTGLGLTFCKLAVEEHDGKIGVESTEGQGAIFWFVLPQAYQKEPNTLPAQTQAAEQVVLPNQLDEAERKLLWEALPALEALDVYYTSDLEVILEKIDFSQTINLQKWGEELKNAIYNFNQAYYKELIAQIRP